MDLKTAAVFGTVETGMEEFHQYIVSSNEELTAIESSLVGDISEEGLVAAFKAVVSVHKGLAGKLTNLLSSGKKQYKTEFGIWNKKEKKVIEIVEGLSSNVIEDIEVDVPTGMSVSYHEMTDLLHMFYAEFNKGSRLDLISKTIDQILTSISQESNGHEQSIVVVNNTLSAGGGKLVSVYDVIMKSFDVNAKAMQKKPFSKAVGKNNGLASIRGGLLALDSNIVDIDMLETHAKETERTVDLSVSYIEDRITGEKEYVPSKAFIKSFIEFIKNIDNTYAMFGNTVLRTLAVQHNITYVYSSIYTATK